MPERPPQSTSEEDRQCRICLDGPDVTLGRLIRPCLCRGTISYVHVKCLQRWRTTSASKSAFYACPQCHYRYAFARTRALGIASNPVFIGLLSTVFFTILVYCASFIATFFTNRWDDGQPSGYFFFGTYYVSPYGVAKDLLRLAMGVLTDEDYDFIPTGDPSSGNGSPTHPLSRVSQGSIPAFLRRVIIGLPVVGVASLVQMLWTMSMLTPFHFFARLRGRGNSRRERSKDLATIIILVAIVAGAIRALWKVYQLTERLAKRVLLRAEDVILEVR